MDDNGEADEGGESTSEPDSGAEHETQDGSQKSVETVEVGTQTDN